MNYYELLEISPSASIEVARNAYKTLAKKYHPDTYKGDTSFAEEKMKLLNEAVSVLEDEAKRNEYNKINGINPLSRSGYSEYGRNNIINFDENGEPIFFSYDIDESEEYNKPDPLSYMEIIDDFLKTAYPEDDPKPAGKRDNEMIPDEIIADIAADISELNAKKFGTDGNGLEEMETDFDDAENPDDEFDVKTKTKSNAKNLPAANAKKNKIYWAVIIFLAVSIILLAILIMQVMNLNNIRNIFSGNPDGEEDISGAFGIDDNFIDEYATEDDNAVFEQPPVHPIDPNPDDNDLDIPVAVTDPPANETEQSIAPPSTTEPATQRATAAQPQPATPVTRPPATARPATTEPPAPPETTETPTEPAITEPATEDEPATEPPPEETTEGPAEDDPPQTEPENIPEDPGDYASHEE